MIPTSHTLTRIFPVVTRHNEPFCPNIPTGLHRHTQLFWTNRLKARLDSLTKSRRHRNACFLICSEKNILAASYETYCILEYVNLFAYKKLSHSAPPLDWSQGVTIKKQKTQVKVVAAMCYNHSTPEREAPISSRNGNNKYYSRSSVNVYKLL